MKISGIEYSRYCQRCGEYASFPALTSQRYVSLWGWGYKIGPDGRRVKVDRFEYRRILRDIVHDIARLWLGRVKVQEKGECATSNGAEKAGEREKRETRRRVGERSKHEYSTTEFIRHFMHSRRALLCIHFYGLESDFLLLKVWGDKGEAEMRRCDRAGTKDGERWLDGELSFGLLSLIPSFISIIHL